MDYSDCFRPLDDEARSRLTELYRRAVAARGTRRPPMRHVFEEILLDELTQVYGQKGFTTTDGERVDFVLRVTLPKGGDAAPVAAWLLANGAERVVRSDSPKDLEEWTKKRLRGGLEIPDHVLNPLKVRFVMRVRAARAFSA